jgi:hypothetical protein
MCQHGEYFLISAEDFSKNTLNKEVKRRTKPLEITTTRFDGQPSRPVIFSFFTAHSVNHHRVD